MGRFQGVGAAFLVCARWCDVAHAACRRSLSLHFHDLRHEAISRFFERGLNVPEVAEVLHSRAKRMSDFWTACWTTTFPHSDC
jgi:hypothetical protein